MNVPFHVYSMRQAIEEGYILDVLANYITYDLKWRLRNLAVDQQESRSPTRRWTSGRRSGNWSSSRCGTHLGRPAGEADRRRLPGQRRAAARRAGQGDGGHLKPPGRAGRCTRRSRRTRSALGYGTLVAFSGSLEPALGSTVTEAQLNGFSEGQLPKMFDYTRADDPHAATSGQAGVPAAGRRGEVPDRVRPAAAVRDVRGQAAHRGRRGADAVPAEPDPPAQVAGRRAGARLRERGAGHRGRVQAVVRDHDRPAGRPQPALRPGSGRSWSSRCSPSPRWRRSSGC